MGFREGDDSDLIWRWPQFDLQIRRNQLYNIYVSEKLSRILQSHSIQYISEIYTYYDHTQISIHTRSDHLPKSHVPYLKEQTTPGTHPAIVTMMRIFLVATTRKKTASAGPYARRLDAITASHPMIADLILYTTIK